MARKKIHYAWVVLVACCALVVGMGLLLSTGGQWFVPVTTELGVGTSQMALYFTIQGLCMAATAPVVGKVLPKANVRILLTLCYAICILAVAAMSQYTAIWQWYISGALLGVAGCFVFIMPTPIILGNWFHKKRGMAIGIAMASMGPAAAIANPIIAAIIPVIGWRNSYLAIAAVTAIIILPCTAFLIRFKPEDKGLLPYGYEAASAEGNTNVDAEEAKASAAPALTGVTPARAYRSVSFWLLFLSVGLLTFLGGIANLLPAYMTSVELLAVVGLIVTAYQVGKFAGNIILGSLSDKYGAVKSSVFGLAWAIVGFILLVACGSNAIIALLGGLAIGFGLSLNTVSPPLLARAAFGDKHFSSLYSTLNVGVSLMGAFGSALLGLVYDLTGSFIPALVGEGIICALLIFLIIASVSMGKRLPRE